jgi:hypothetical protein
LFYFHFVKKIPPSLSLIKVMEGEGILTVVEVGTVTEVAAGVAAAGVVAAGGEDTMRNPSI